MKVEHVAVNIALNVSVNFTEIPENRIKFDNNHLPHITFLQFFTKYSYIHKIYKIIKDIKIPNFNIKSSLSINKINNLDYIYSIDIDSPELKDFYNYLKEKVSDYIEFPENYYDCFCEKITYQNLPNLVLNFLKKDYKPHITIGISTVNTNINYSNINVKNLDLYKVGDNGTAIPIIKSFFYCHRINNSDELDEIDENYGVELDLRDKGENVVLVHDPFKGGELFCDYLRKYNKSSIILNVKSERIEYKVLDLLREKGINDYFFLDCSFPMIYQLNKNYENNIAIRFSEFEPIESVLSCKNMVKWVWVDCFTKFPLDEKSYKIIKECGLKICLVSPELQGHSIDMIKDIRDVIINNNFEIDAICTKYYNIKNWV